MSDLKFELVTVNYAKLDEVKKIYEEAFPENERGSSIYDFLKVSELTGLIDVMAIEEDQKLIGILVLLKKEEYIFIFFMAITSTLRGGGYGSRIMKEITEHYPNKIILFDIENPHEKSPNYEQRVKRKAFFERLGYTYTGLQFKEETDNYLIMCNEKTDNLKKYIRDYIETCKGMIQKYGDAIIPYVENQMDEYLKHLED